MIDDRPERNVRAWAAVRMASNTYHSRDFMENGRLFLSSAHLPSSRDHHCPRSACSDVFDINAIMKFVNLLAWMAFGTTTVHK
jgi:hypothetical protein